MRTRNYHIMFIFPLALMFAVLTGSSLSAQIPEGITGSFSKGNSRELSRYFNDNIELVVLNNENVYSKSQAELIIRNFFSENKPIGFELLHTVGPQASRFAIGNLKTENGDYRVSFLLKLKDSLPLIHLLRIERVEGAMLTNDKNGSNRMPLL